MSRPSYSEIEGFLNDRDAQRGYRREHHLPREEYHRTDLTFFVTLCARHQGQPFRNAELARAVVASLLYRREHGFWHVYAYCLMPDHLHAVVQLSSPDGQNGLTAPSSTNGKHEALSQRLTPNAQHG